MAGPTQIAWRGPIHYQIWLIAKNRDHVYRGKRRPVFHNSLYYCSKLQIEEQSPSFYVTLQRHFESHGNNRQPDKKLNLWRK